MLLFLPLNTGNEDTGLMLVDTSDDDSSSNVDVVKSTVEESDESFIDPDAEPFIPSKDWQVVKEGQSVPAGLHIRMNFQTHVKEAKLMDGDNGERFSYLAKKDQKSNKSTD